MIEFYTPDVAFRFACPPGTGAAWFVRAAGECGVTTTTTDFRDAYPLFADDCGGIFKVSVVRHPVNWFEDCYQRGDAGVMAGLRRDSLGTFASDYMRLAAGAVGRLFDRHEADTVLRVEDFPWSFLELMDSLGVSKQMRDRVTVLGKPRPREVQRLPRDVRRMVARAERETMERYDYHE